MSLLITDIFCIKRILPLILIGCLFTSVSFAQYKELEVLRQSSHETLSGYARRLADENAKFEGIVKFGQALQAINDETKVDVAKLTYHSRDYWRAVLEITPQDSSILLTHAYLHAARGETAWADVYFLLGGLTGKRNNRVELGNYKQLRNELQKKVGQQIREGIAYHDKQEYAKALEVYDRVIAGHPNSALAYYEKGLSYMLMSRKDPSLKKKAMQMYAECRLRDPFHWKAYQGSDPNVIQKLQVYLKQVHPFLSGKARNREGLAVFAEGCEAMELYPFAAHAQWKLALIDADNVQQHLKKFIDLIEKSGCEEADFFRGNTGDGPYLFWLTCDAGCVILSLCLEARE